MELLVDGLIESGQILLVSDLLAIVTNECREQFAVGSLVPLLAVVIEDDILLLGLVCRTLDLLAPVAAPGTRRHLVVETEERLAEQGTDAGQHHALLVERLQGIEVQAAEIGTLDDRGGVHPLTDAGLELLLLLDESNGVNALVHANAVLPVIAGVGILRLIHDTDGL